MDYLGLKELRIFWFHDNFAMVMMQCKFFLVLFCICHKD